MSFKGKILFLATALVNLLILFAVVAAIPVSKLFPIINSDSLFFQILYTDLFIDGGTLLGWDLNTVFNLFPNSILYLVAFAISQNAFINTVIHGLLQMALFFGVLLWFYRSFAPQIPVHWHVPGLMLISLFFADGVATQQYYITSLFIHPYHFGAFITFFLLTGANLRYNRSQSNIMAIFIVVIALLGAFSNRIILIMFTIPWTVVMLISWLKNRTSTKLLLRSLMLNILGAAGGMALFSLLKSLKIFTFASNKLFSWDNVIPSFQAMYKVYVELWGYSTYMSILTSLSLIYLVYSLAWGIRDVFFKRKNVGYAVAFNDYNHYLLLSTGFMLLVFLAPAINGMFFSIASIRYNFFVMLLPLTNIGVIAWRHIENRPIAENRLTRYISASTVLFAFVFLLAFMINNPVGKSYSEKVDYYPPLAQELDKLAETHQLKNGVSLYWDAKVTTVFSRNNIKVRQVYENLALYPLAAARSWYYPQKSGGEVPVFNFIIYKPEIKWERITEIFGEANIKEISAGNNKILLVPEFTFNQDRSIHVLSDLSPNNI